MIICGLKLTHDGAVALLRDDEVIFSVEMEKLRNNKRYTVVEDLAVVQELLADFGYRVTDVDAWSVDGWDGRTSSSAPTADHGWPTELVVGPYREQDGGNPLESGYQGEFAIGDVPLRYTSYPHVAGHLVSAYASSGFAARGEPSFVLIWDGGLFPRLYFADPAHGVESGGALFPLTGHAYATAAHHFGPFKRADEATTVDDLSVAGKLMAYIALGEPRADVIAVLGDLFKEHFESSSVRAVEYRREIGGFGSNSEPSVTYLHAYFRDVAAGAAALGATDEDVLASIHLFLENLLVQRTAAKMVEWKGSGPWNLCFVGGCALNIKWNSALRAMPVAKAVWVPPFPNDSGSALGTAAAHRAHGLGPLTWHARLGPALAPSELPDGWTSRPCTPEELARFLHETGRPVVLLDGRAELGPRALGGRSIIAPAIDPAMKETLNRIKKREHYRPVAPICLTEHAPTVFDPGTPDPYMLFDHDVRPDWAERIPAVLHLDGTARLQTVSRADDPVLESVLREYHRLSGIPVLCNTSANFNGRGFFPDVASAARWGEVDAIWSAGTLHRQC